MNKLVWVAHRSNTNNLGDRLLGMGLVRLLKARGLKVRRTEFIGKSDGTFAGIYFKLLKKLHLRGLSSFLGVLAQLPRAVKERPDTIIVGGGQLLLPTAHFLLSLLAWSLVARASGARFAVFSVGTECRRGGFSVPQRGLLRGALNLATVVRLRDRHSQRLIYELTGREFPVVPDSAYGLDLRPPCRQGTKLGICICPATMKSVRAYARFRDQQSYFAAFADLVAVHHRDGEEVSLVSTTRSDQFVVKDLANDLTSRYPTWSIKALGIPEDEQALLGTLTKARVVIGSRMHAVILGHILGARAISVDRNEKMAAFSRDTLVCPASEVQRQLSTAVDDLLLQVRGRQA